MTSLTLTEEERTFIDLVMEVGETALDQDTCEFMIEEGVPAEPFIGSHYEYTLGEVLESLAAKGFVQTESHAEVIHYNGGIRGKPIEPIKWENTGFKKVDRTYIYFTTKLKSLYLD